MALDTAARRWAALGYGRRYLPWPDGTLAEDDRLTLLGLFAQPEAGAEPVQPPYASFARTRAARTDGFSSRRKPEPVARREPGPTSRRLA